MALTSGSESYLFQLHALAYGLYGDKLFDDYEQRFLKRDVQGEIIARTFSPGYWGDLWSTGWGRSELAARSV